MRLVLVAALACASLADAGNHNERVPAPGAYRFRFDYTDPDMPVNRIARGTYQGVVRVGRDGELAITDDKAGTHVVYRGRFTRSIPWRRGMRLVLMKDGMIALHDERELLYGCGADEGGNGDPCVDVLQPL